MIQYSFIPFSESSINEGNIINLFLVSSQIIVLVCGKNLPTIEQRHIVLIIITTLSSVILSLVVKIDVF